MPYPRSHLYVTWGGTAWAGAEIWQTGVRFDRATAVSEAELEVCADAISAWMGRGPNFSSRVLLSWAKAAIIGTDGLYPPTEEATVYDYEPPISGGYTGTAAVPQITLAVSFDTARRRGLAARGRMYLPALEVQTNTEGFTGFNSLATSSTVTLLTDLQDALNAQAIIASNGKSPGQPERAGAIEPITGVRAGNVYDTQRRRRNRLQEVYTVVTPLPPA